MHIFTTFWIVWKNLQNFTTFKKILTKYIKFDSIFQAFEKIWQNLLFEKFCQIWKTIFLQSTFLSDLESNLLICFINKYITYQNPFITPNFALD